MLDARLLPIFPLSMNIFIAIGLVLIISLLIANFFERYTKLPALLGYVATGLLIGPPGLGLIDNEMLDKFKFFFDVALALIIFELGRRVDYRWLLREKWLLITALTLSFATFVALMIFLFYLDYNTPLIGIAAAIGMSTSPAVILTIVRELKAEGQMTDRLITIVAINSALAFLIFSLYFSLLHMDYQTSDFLWIFHAFYLVAGSILLGLLLGWCSIALTRLLIKSQVGHTLLIIGFIILAIGFSYLFAFSSFVVLLSFGMASRNLDKAYNIIEPDFNVLDKWFYIIFFVFVGAKLELQYIPQLLPTTLLFILIRFSVMTATTSLLAKYNGMTYKKGFCLGAGLLPLSGISLVMVYHTLSSYPVLSGQLAALLISVVAILEIIGPIFTRKTLISSGESKLIKE